MLSEIIRPETSLTIPSPASGCIAYSSECTPPDPNWIRRYIARDNVTADKLHEAMRAGDAICLEGEGLVDVLFFDVDGCACAYPHGGGAKEFTQICALFLKDFAAACPGVMLVVISDRRLTPESYDELKHMMIDAGVPMQFMGCTPDLREDHAVPAYSRRAREVGAWLAQWWWVVKKAAILDDSVFGYEDVDGLPPLWSPDPAIGLDEKITRDLISYFHDAPH